MEKHSLEIWSPQFRNRRGIDVYLPESYPEGRFRYPVVYLQDGQNLSDPSIAFCGNTWRLGDGLVWLAERGIEPIIVGIHNTPARLMANARGQPDRVWPASAGGSAVAISSGGCTRLNMVRSSTS